MLFVSHFNFNSELYAKIRFPIRKYHLKQIRFGLYFDYQYKFVFLYD